MIKKMILTDGNNVNSVIKVGQEWSGHGVIQEITFTGNDRFGPDRFVVKVIDNPTYCIAASAVEYFEFLAEGE